MVQYNTKTNEAMPPNCHLFNVVHSCGLSKEVSLGFRAGADFAHGNALTREMHEYYRATIFLDWDVLAGGDIISDMALDRCSISNARRSRFLSSAMTLSV